MRIKNYCLLLSLLCLITVVLVSSCAKDDDSDDEPITVFDDGIFIANQSSELSLNGSVSYYDRTRDEVANDIFSTKNNTPLTGPLYSIHAFNNKAYLVQEEAGQIAVADAVSMEQVGIINDLDLPHYFLPINSSKAYVSQWGNDGVSGSIKVIDLAAAESDLVINNTADVLYSLNPEAASWVYEHPINSNTLSTVPFTNIPVSHLGHDPQTDWLIGADIKSGQSNGDFILFDGSGAEQIRFEVGVGPGEFWAE